MSARAASDREQVFRPATVRGPWAIVLFVVVGIVCLLPAAMTAYYGTIQSRLAYRVSAAGITVEMGVGKIVIPAADVAGVDLLADPGRVRRAFGAGLRGLQMGWYTMGGQRVYRLTTGGQELVYVDTAAGAAAARPNTRYVFSPEDADRFVALVRAAQAGEWAEVAGGVDEAVFSPQPGPSVLTDPFLWLAIAATLPIAIGFPWVVTAGARGMHYRVGPDGIAVHHLGRKLYRWQDIKSVQRLDQVPRLWRVFGASLPGYHVGDFIAGSLGTVKVYASRLKPPMVLLETTRGRRVLLGPEDVDGLLNAVEHYR